MSSLHVLPAVGDGPLVVLVHGAMDRSTGLARATRHLTDHTVIRYDRRGYGRSVDAGPTDVHGHIDDLLAVVDGRPATVVGHSFGGLVAMGAAARPGSAIVAVGAYEAPMAWESWWPGRAWARDTDGQDAAEQVIRGFIGDNRWARMPETWRTERRREGLTMLQEMRSIAGPGAPFDLADVTVPVLVGHGSESPERHLRGARKFPLVLPRATVHRIDGVGHDAPMRRPADYAEFVRAAVRCADPAPTDGGAEGDPARAIHPAR